MLAVLYGFGVVRVWHVYTLMFIRAAGGVCHWPAMRASTTLLVPEKHYSRVAGLNQTLWGITGIVAPPLGALLLGLLPMQGILAIDVGTALLAITMLLFVQIPQPARKETVGKAPLVLSVVTDIRDGLRFVWSRMGLMAIITIATLVNLLVNPAFALLPILVTRHFQGGALELAWLDSAAGIGVVLGGATLGVWGGFRRRVMTLLSALILFSGSIVVLGLTPATAFLLAVGALFIVGFCAPFLNGSLEAIAQATVPAEIQGRVFALVLSGARAVSPLGLAIAGPVADALGVQVWFLVGGIAQLAIGVGAFFVPAVMRIEKGPPGNRYGSIRIAGDDGPGA